MSRDARAGGSQDVRAGGSSGAGPSSGAAASSEADALAFLGELAAALHLAYLPSDLVELRVAAAARGLGVEVETLALQSAVLLQARGTAARLVRKDLDPHWDLGRLHAIVTLCERVARGELGIAAARAELERILAEPDRFGLALVVAGFALYGGAVAARVGGGWVEMLAATLIGVLAGGIHLGVLGRVGDLPKAFIAGFVTALAAFALDTILPPFDATRAVFGAATLLVPSMMVTLAAHELASGAAAESGVVRLVLSLLRFVMIGAGVFAAAHAWSVLGGVPPVPAVEPLPKLAVGAVLAVGAIGLAICMLARPADVPWIVAAVLFAWGTQEVTKAVLGGRGSPFAAALVVAIAGSLYGRLPGKIPATVIFPALYQLVPGFIGTQAVLAAIQPGEAASAATLFDTVLVAVQLVLGLVAGAAIARRGRGGAGIG